MLNSSHYCLIIQCIEIPDKGAIEGKHRQQPVHLQHPRYRYPSTNKETPPTHTKGHPYIYIFFSTDKICYSACSATIQTSPRQPCGRCCMCLVLLARPPACMLTGSASPANKPVVEECSDGMQASPVLCHYPAPGRVEGDHHFHITNRRLLFCRQFPQVEN